MSALSLRTLGAFQVKLNGQTWEKFRTSRVAALLAYLAADAALNGRLPQRREKLFTLLWPGMLDKSARANLRQTLYLLRQNLPNVAGESGDGRQKIPLVLSDYQTVQIHPDVCYEHDMATFLELLKSVQSHDHPDLSTCRHCQGLLEEAVTQYHGPFLSDLYLPDSSAFDDWTLAIREMLQRQMLDALETLTIMYLRQADYPQAEATARRQLAIDDLRESAYRLLMETLARHGRREAALTEYETCRRLLAEELGMAPTSQTTAVYEQIRAGEIGLVVPSQPAVRGYDLAEQIGAGVFGTVYRAIQARVGREVAIKVISPQFANHPHFIRRFDAEAQLVARLEHPHIVPLYDYWREPDGAYLVMRYLRGGSLADALAAGPWPLARVALLLDQGAAALAAAHRQQIIHRDIKPANILLDEEGNAYLSDFGLARIMDDQTRTIKTLPVTGSPAYLSPEQLERDQPVTPLSDQYSLGIILYQALTGRQPFPGASLSEMLYKHLQETIPLTHELCPEIPGAVDDVIQRATARSPQERYPDVLDLATAFRQAAVELEVSRPAALEIIAAPPDREMINPYKGLRAFQEVDAAYFFGRETLVAQLLDRLAEPAMEGPAAAYPDLASSSSCFVAVVGPSGSGKSSAVKAGLIPRLRQGALPGSEKWFIAEMAPGTHPFEELEAALLPVAVNPPPSLLEPLLKDERGLLRTVKRVLPQDKHTANPSQLLLLIDQFEELFTLVEDESARNHFLSSLIVAVTEPRGRLRVVVTLRADFYDRPLLHPGIAELVRQSTVPVVPMTAAELEQAIRAPAALVGVGQEPGLVAAITAEVAGQPGGLPLLQYALMELFERRRGCLMTLAAYREMGGVMGALGRRAEEIYAAQDEARQETTRQIFLRLVTLGEGVEDTRRRVLRAELEMLGGDEVGMVEVIEAFGHRRLMTFDRDPLTRGPTVEVAHEALLREWPRLRGWLDESRADVRLQRLLAQAAGEWTANNHDPGFLLRQARLDQFAGWAAGSDIALTRQEKRFLEASLSARQQRQAEEAARLAHEAALERRSRRVLQILAAVFLLAAVISGGLAIWASAERNRAESAEQQALRQVSAGLASQALIELEGSAPDRGILLALEALQNYPYTAAAERALAKAILESRPYLDISSQAFTLEDAAWSPSGDRIVAGGWQGFAAVWDAATGKRLTTLGIPAEGFVTETAWALDWSPGSDQIAVAYHTGTVKIWDATTGEQLHLLRGQNMFTAAEWSPDGSALLAGQGLGTLLIWDVPSETETHTLFHSRKAITDVAWSPDGARIATSSRDGTIKLWDVATGAEQQTLTGHTDAVNSIAWSPSGREIASTSFDGTLRVWDPGYSANSPSLPFNIGIAQDVVWSPAGQYVAAVGSDGTVTVYALNPPMIEEILSLPGLSQELNNLAWSPQGDRLLVSAGVTLRLWDVSDLPLRLLTASRPLVVSSAGRCILRDKYLPCEPLVGQAEWSPGANRIAISRSGVVEVWDAQTGTILSVFDHDFTAHSLYESLSWSPDGERILASRNDLGGKVTIWEAKTGKRQFEQFVPGGILAGLSWSPAGDRFLTRGRDDHIIRIWDAATGEELAHFAGTAAGGPGLQMDDPDWHPDGDRLVTNDADNVARVWDVYTGESILTLFGHEDSVLVANWSPDGSRIVTTSIDGTARVWDGETGALLLTFAGHTSMVWDAQWSPNGSRIASAEENNRVIVWDAATGEERYGFTTPGSVYFVNWSPDGRQIIASGFSNTPLIQPAWQSTEELIAYAQDCCVRRQLTPRERELFELPPR